MKKILNPTRFLGIGLILGITAISLSACVPPPHHHGPTKQRVVVAHPPKGHIHHPKPPGPAAHPRPPFGHHR